jgi:hypothetical protein
MIVFGEFLCFIGFDLILILINVVDAFKLGGNVRVWY